MENERTYTDQQVKDILMKAVDLQQQGALAASSDPNGLSREQLLKMASELGIDPTYVDAAIDQSRISHREDKSVTFLGIPLARTHSAVVEGELDPERFDVIVPELGNNGLKGVGSAQVGRSLTARISKGLAFGPMSVVSRDGKTKIEGRHQAFLGIMGGLYPAFILSTLLGATMAKVGSPMLTAGVVTALMTAGVGAFTLMARRADEAMKSLVARVAEIVAEETKAQGVRENLARATATTSTPAIEVSDQA